VKRPYADYGLFLVATGGLLMMARHTVVGWIILCGGMAVLLVIAAEDEK